MSNTLHKLNIDLTKITGAKVITGKDQIQYLAIDIAKSGIYYQGKGAYLNLDMRENKDGEDQYGNSHMLTISPTKEQREAKERTPIVGNAKTMVFGSSQQQSKPAVKDDKWIDDDDQTIPF